MAKTIWAIDFGAWSLKTVRGSYDKKTDTISVDLADEIRYGELPCGYDASPLEKQREAIIEFRRKYDIAAGDDLCVSVTGSEVFSRFINLPPVPESIDEIIRYEARQQIPFNIDDVIWDYQSVKPREQLEIGEEIECGLFALKKDRVSELLDVLEPWRANLRIIQNAPLALYNLLQYEGLVDEPCVVLDVGASTTDVLVLNPPRFWVRSLLMAGNDLTNALVEKFGVSQDEAEKIKRRISRTRHREQIINILEPVFDEIANEIQRSLGYYKSLVREVKFDKALLMGSAMRMAGTREMLRRRLQYDVRTMDKLERIKMAPGADSEELRASLAGFGAALGLLVQGAGKARVRINMVPEEIALAGELSEKKPWVLTAAIGVLVIVGVVFAFETAYGARLGRVDSEVNWGLVEKIDQLNKQYQSKQNKIRQLENNPVAQLANPGVARDLYLDLLPALAQALPRDVYLVSLDCAWQEPDEIEEFVQAQSRRSTRRTRRGPQMPPTAGGQEDEGPPAWLSMEMLTGEVGPEGLPPEARAGRPQGGEEAAEGFAVGKVEAVKSAQSQLVVRFSAESRVVRRGKAFIEEKVLGALRNAKFGGDDVLAFKKVELIGELRDVYRRALDGEEVDNPVPGRTEHFVAFDAYAVVNVEGSKAAQEQQQPQQ